jgi:hypothetical protein
LSGSQTGRPSSKSWPIIRNWNRTTSLPCTRTLPSWRRTQSLRRMKLLFDESLQPKPVALLSDLFPESENALRNGLAGVGDRRMLDYAATHDPTDVAAEVLRRNAIRLTALADSQDQLIVLEQ